MISSICKAWQTARSSEGTPPLSPDALNPDVTRSQVLRGITAGALVAGVTLTAEQAIAGETGRAKAVIDIDKVYDTWQDCFNAGDLDGLIGLYTSDVLYVDPKGNELVGKANVRANLAEIVALKPTIILGDRRHLLYRDIALTTNHWKLTIPGPNGSKQEIPGGGIEVMRKQADQGWQYIIDDASRSAN